MVVRPVPFLLGVALLLAGCQPKIGDDCRIDTDCTQLGDRVCDTTQPGGYCSKFNCSPTNCPADESICVAFNSYLSEVEGCKNPNEPSPFERTFCMRTCASDADCRPGYACIDVAAENPWGAVVIQRTPRTTMICAVPSSAPPVDQDLLSTLPENVCQGSSGLGGASGTGVAGSAGSLP